MDKKELSDYNFKAIKHITIKNLLWVFISVSILILLLRIIFLIKKNVLNIENYILFFILEIIILFLLLALLFLIKSKVIPFITKIKDNISQGKIWFLCFINLDPKDSGTLISVYLSVYLYNLIMFVFGFVILICFFYFIFTLIFSIIMLVMVPVFNYDPQNFSTLVFIAVTSLTLFILAFETIHHSHIDKKIIYLFLKRKFDEIKYSEDKKIIFQKVILKFLKNYYLSMYIINDKYITNKLMQQIVAYYEKVALFLINEKTIFNKIYPKLHEIIIKDKYSDLLGYLDYINKESKKNDKYKQHLKLLCSYKEELKSDELITFSENLRKIRFRLFDLNLIIKKTFHFFKDSRLGNILILIVIIFIFLALLNHGKVDFLIEFVGFNKTEAKELILNIP